MNAQKNTQFVHTFWDQQILPALQDYILIPNKSPMFDRDWRTHGYMDQAFKLVSAWCQKQAIPGMKLEVVQMEERTPVLLIDIPGSNDETVLLYGHLDKQPEMTGWDSDLHPWRPVLRGDKLYGRGSADDGYAVFASLAAVKSLREQNLPHARCVILIEGCEESGSFDLPFYIEALKDRIGQPSLVICLDSGCGNYEQLWLTTSLRGVAGGTLQINVLRQGLHSGSGSGVVPSCWLILRQLLNRIENEKDGTILLNDLFVEIPEQRITQAKRAAHVLSDVILEEIPFVDGVKPLTTVPAELILRRTWHPALSIVGIDGVPSIENAGNVTLPSLAVKLSFRLPPTCPPEKTAQHIKAILEKNPPYGAQVEFKISDIGPGWNAPAEEPWLADAANNASNTYFGKEAVYLGEGASIPFMGMLGKKFPQAQFIITGVLGPGANAHGPNEFLHIPTAKKLTSCVAEIIAVHFKRK